MHVINTWKLNNYGMCLTRKWKCHLQKSLLWNRSLWSKAMLIQLGRFKIFFSHWMLKSNSLAILFPNHFTQCLCHSLLTLHSSNKRKIHNPPCTCAMYQCRKSHNWADWGNSNNNNNNNHSHNSSNDKQHLYSLNCIRHSAKMYCKHSSQQSSDAIIPIKVKNWG